MKMKRETEVIKKGAVLMTAKPFAYVLKSKLQGERCDHCFVKTEVLRCSGCKFVHYCSKNCQKLGWVDHCSECSGFKKVSPHIVPDAARLMGKIIMKLKRGGEKERGWIPDTNKFRVFRDLMNHYSDIKQDKTRMEHFESLVAVLASYLGQEKLPNEAEMLGIYGRICVNSFSILEAEMLSVGTGIYLAPSLIDHSCRPSAMATFEGTTITIRALQDLRAPLDWTKVRISYVELLSSTADRRRELQSGYYFLCDCPVCSDPQAPENRTLRAMGCSAEGCQAPVPVPLQGGVEGGVRCPQCGAHLKGCQVAEYLEELQVSTQQLENMKDIAYLDVARQCLRRHEQKHFHPLDLVHACLLDSAFESAIALQQWEEAEQYGAALRPAFRHYYGPSHPLTGLLHLKLAKIQNLLGLTPDLRDNLRVAEDILTVAYGRSSSLYRDQLLPLLHQAAI